METVRTLSALLQGKDARIIALTRNVNSDTVKSMADPPGVEREEKLYTEIDADWVKARSIDRAFIASQASQVDDLASTLTVAALHSINR
jgi:hypothetical protein